MHVLTPTVMTILADLVDKAESAETSGSSSTSVTLSDALATLAKQEKYLALEERAQRYDVGVKYGLLTAQLALALNGRDRDLVLTRLVELLATQTMGQLAPDGQRLES
jgi:UTP--glucose-1-phosphate uridylyltransferase